MSFEDEIINNINKKESLEFLFAWKYYSNRKKKSVLNILNSSFDNKLNILFIREKLDEIVSKMEFDNEFEKNISKS